MWLNVRDLKVRIEAEERQIRGDAAEVRVRQAMEYRLEPTREERSRTFDLQLFLRRVDGAWRLERFELKP